MIQVNVIPKPEEGKNFSKVVIALNSVNDAPYSLQYAVSAFGKDTEGSFMPLPLYNGLYKLEGENWSNWTSESADSDNAYISGLVLASLGVEQDMTQPEIAPVEVVTEEPTEGGE